MSEDRMAQLAIKTMQTLSIGTVQAAKSCHPGTPMVPAGSGNIEIPCRLLHSVMVILWRDSIT